MTNPLPTTFVSTDQVEAVMATGIDSDALAELIARQESWLARQIGALSGPRTQRIWVGYSDYDALILQRPTDAVSVVDAGVALVDEIDVRLIGDRRIERPGAWAGPLVQASYSPIDELEVTEAVLDLVRLAISASPFQTEASESHSYTRSNGRTVADLGLERRMIAQRFTVVPNVWTVRATPAGAPDRWTPTFVTPPTAQPLDEITR